MAGKGTNSNQFFREVEDATKATYNSNPSTKRKGRAIEAAVESRSSETKTSGYL